MTVNGIEVEVQGFDHITEEEIVKYMNQIEKKDSEQIANLSITLENNDQVALDYTIRPQKFDRIRRITGYLVGTTDRWNNAKRNEEHDRVKHGIH